MIEWDVQKGKPQCEACATKFLDTQSTHCLLRMNVEPPARQDYCQRCWAYSIAPTLPSMGDYASWTSRYKLAVPVGKEEPVKKSHAELVFRKLLASQDPSMKNVLFVLAVLLERKKILKQLKVVRPQTQEASPPAKKNLVYTHRETSESIWIEDPQIRLSEWHKIEREVKELLEAELAVCS